MKNNSEDYCKIIAAKLSCLFAIGVLSFVCGILPYYLLRAWSNRFPTSTIHKITSGVICFSGGTLLGVAFLHLLPEVRVKIAAFQSDGSSLITSVNLPLSDIIAMAGFFGVYVLDELMHLCVEWYSVRVRRTPEEIKEVNPSWKQMMIKANPKVCSQLPHEMSVFSLDKHENSKHQVSISRRSNHHANPVTSCVCQSPKLNQNDVIEEKELASMTTSQVTVCCERGGAAIISSKRERNLESPRIANVKLPPISGLITIVALSFHDIFEGMAVGVEQDLSSILFLYLSIASHKYAIAFCIGIDLVLAGSRLKLIMLSMMTFSIVSPLGVVIGMMIVVQNSDGNEVNFDSPTSVVLQGVACGTLIYVVCFEVLQREGTDTHAKGIQNVVFVIGGFLVTLGFKILVGHSHSH